MDKRATITILVGLGIFVVGIIGFVIGGFGVAGIEESTKFTLEDVDNGTIYLKDSDGQGELGVTFWVKGKYLCLLYTSPSPRDRTRSRMPSSA